MFSVNDCKMDQIKGVVQDCSNSITNALELLQSCTEVSESSVNLSLLQYYKIEMLFSLMIFDIY